MLFLATGIDREASVVFVRSHVHEHVELAYLLHARPTSASCPA
jgi:tryptophanyl-tRNA synthetase